MQKHFYLKKPYSPKHTIFEYSENPEKLYKVLRNYTFEAFVINDANDKNVIKSEAEVMSKRLPARKFLIKITAKDGFIITYEFTESRFSTWTKTLAEQIDELLYNVLTDIRSYYFIDDNFSDFCSSFGYDEDSRSKLKMFENCLTQAKKYQKMFKECEVECLPE